MNTKKLILLVIGLLTIQLFVPNYSASEVTKQTTEQSNVRYAPVNPTPEEVAAADPTDIVVFADEILEAYVAARLGVNVGEITVEDMARLTYIIKPVSNLSGLEYAVNLNNITIIDSNLSDLSPIANLTKLTSLSVRYGNITDLSPIANLTNLKTLLINDNNISDLSPLSNLTHLTSINIVNNNITDLSPLSNLTNTVDLIFQNNNVTDLSPISNLTKIENLFFQENNVSDLSPLVNLTSTKRLLASNNNISDVSALVNFNNLTELELNSNNLSDLSPLANLPKLTWIKVENNHIGDISKFMEFANKANLTVDMANQSIELPNITVTSNDNITYNIVKLNGEIVPLSLGRPKIGENSLSSSKFITNVEGFPRVSSFTVTVTQKVTFRTISGLDAANSNEGTVLTDEQLIDLFNIASVDGDITVDKSAVDFNTPGTYNIVFSDRLDTITCELTVSDLAPTFLLTNDSINITLGDIIDDYITTFGVSATEIIDGDLTNSITIDDSVVDFNTPGSYNVVFTAVDDEGNNADATATVVISQIPEIISEVKSENEAEIQSENNTEVKSENVSDIVTDTTNVDNSTNVSDVTTDQTKNKTMTADKQQLSSTGSLNAILAAGLITIVTMLYTVKKTVVNNK